MNWNMRRKGVCVSVCVCVCVGVDGCVGRAQEAGHPQGNLWVIWRRLSVVDLPKYK